MAACGDCGVENAFKVQTPCGFGAEEGDVTFLSPWLPTWAPKYSKVSPK